MRAPREGMTGRVLMRRWLNTGPHLQILFLLGGAAIAISFASIDLLLGGAIWGWEIPWPLRLVVVALVVSVPPTLVGLSDSIREIEETAARRLLGAKLPDPVRDDSGHRSQVEAFGMGKARSCAWFWIHILTGAAAAVCGAAVIVNLISAVHLVFASAPGQQLWGMAWAEATAGPEDWWVVGVSVIIVGGYVLALTFAGLVLRLLAPTFLGPTLTQRLAELDRQVTRAVERNRLARDLHDSVGHALSVVVLQTALARQSMGPNKRALNALEVAQSSARRALKDLDSVIGLLRRMDGTAPQAEAAPDLGQLRELVIATDTGPSRSVAVRAHTLQPETLPPIISREGYRIVQEALTNSIRYGRDPIDVELSQDVDSLTIVVTNGLAGPRSSRGMPGGGRGLLGMRERVEGLGGHIDVGRHQGRWCVDVSLPLTDKRMERM